MVCVFSSSNVMQLNTVKFIEIFMMKLKSVVQQACAHISTQIASQLLLLVFKV